MPAFHSFALIVEIVATLAFAASGLLAAARKRLDAFGVCMVSGVAAFGVCMVSGVAAFGGGTLRDVLLDRRPFFWVQHPGWVWALLGLCLLALAGLRGRHLAFTERAILVPDALGLGLFSVLGTMGAWSAGMPAIVAVLMGILTAVFGGVLRDLLCNELPKAFSDHQPYAVLAFAGGWLAIGLDRLGLKESLTLGLAALVTSALRLCALQWNWRLPAWRALDAEGRQD